MKTGTLQRRWSENAPQAYDRETRLVCMDIRAEQRPDQDGELVDGYSYLQVEIDSLIDYGHIKSQLIEAGYAQKDEFGLLMNVVEEIVDNALSANSWAAFKSSLSEGATSTFVEFCQFRAMCADAAHVVMDAYSV